MQRVSEAWIAAQQQTLVPESFVEIKLTVSDPEISGKGSVTADAELDVLSDASTLANEQEKNPQPCATLEHNLWALDGSRTALPDNSSEWGDQGFIGPALSGEDGTFETTPTITISFAQTVTTTIPGITIHWATAYGEWPVEFTVTAYLNGGAVAERTVSDNTEITTAVSMDMSNFNTIVVKVHRWCLPWRRCRIDNILVGLQRTYSKTDLLSYSHTEFADPLSAELPKSEISFTVSNINGEYNPDNPNGLAKYIIERQRVSVLYGYKLGDKKEWIQGGVFYLSEWETPQNGIQTSFTARDALEYMSDIYSGVRTGTLAQIAEAALVQADLPLSASGEVLWTLDSSLSGIQAGVLDEDQEYTIAEVLQLVANAGCCVFYQDRDGVLHIEPLIRSNTDYSITTFNAYQYAELKLSKQLKAVDINDGTYVLTVGDIGETQYVNNPLITENRAQAVAEWTAAYLAHRTTLTGEFRSDPRLEVLDRITNENKFSTSVVMITEIDYTYNGAFQGSYEGRSGA